MKPALLDVMIEAARDAASVIRAVYETAFEVEYKSPSDPVTLADQRANELICARLGAAFPGVPVVAEESDPESYRHFRDSDRIFFVDPLDGTREFVLRNGEFVVMLGLVDGERATHGVIYAPTSDAVWAAERGTGAFHLTRGGTRSQIGVSSVASLDGARIMVSRSHRSYELEQALNRSLSTQFILRGSAGLKAAEVADGSGDGYAALGPSGKRWDVCAPEALILAAGGAFSDLRGAVFDYRVPDLTNHNGICAANPRLHRELLEHAAPLLREDHT